jgi:hypothetical protein
MDVVPAFVAVDGVKFPLSVSPQGVGLANDAAYPGLDALSYVAGHWIARARGERLAELTERRSLQQQALAAFFIEPKDRDDLGDGVENWTRLAGAPPDLGDAYFVGTDWIRASLVVPRSTLIRLIEQVGALDDAVKAHMLEPRIDGVPEAGPVSRPPQTDGDADADADAAEDADADLDGDSADTALERPSRIAAAATGAALATPPTPGLAADDLLREIDAVAAQVDDLDAAARHGDEPYTSVERNADAAARRGRLFIELDVAGLFAPALADQARAALTRLGLTRLLAYHGAGQALARYLASPERAARFPGEPPPPVTAAQVSLDWFRIPAGYRPDGVTEYEWLALCERNFASPLPSSSAGVRFVRLCGAMHQLRYRAEVGPAPCLWRAQLAPLG